MRTSVAVVGGGYGGIVVAKALDAITDVVLIEPRETFVHNVAALRALTDARWAERMLLPYDRLLRNGRVLRDRAVQVEAGSVTVAAGTRIEADHIVLATGSTYPFPAKVSVTGAAAAKDMYGTARRALAGAGGVLLLGAGPVGLELAGEIKAAWPDKSVTIVDPGDVIVPGGYSHAFRQELHRQLDELGIRVILGASLREPPPSEPGEAGPFTVTLSTGERLTAEVWFRCYGAAPATGFLGHDLATARRADGLLEVTPELRLRGFPQVFALGDITAVPEAKQASGAMAHGGVIAANIGTLLEGGGTLETYQPGPPGIVLPLGPYGGATYAPDWETHLDVESAASIRKRAEQAGDTLIDLDILGPETTSEIKGTDLMVGEYAELLGLE